MESKAIDPSQPADPAGRFRLGELAIDPVTLTGALGAVERLVGEGRGGFVVTPNVDHVMIAERRPAFREAYGAASLSLADGQPVVWASRLLGAPLPEKVSGSDLVVPLMALAARRGWRVALCGAAPEVAALAAARLREREGVEVVATVSPYVTADSGVADPEGDSAVAALRAARPQLVLVAFGAPKQELWMHRREEELAPAVLIGVGASLDFLAGRVRRAPRWVSRAGLEWLWRLSREPRRLWRRYLVDDPGFARVVARELFRRRAARRAARGLDTRMRARPR